MARAPEVGGRVPSVSKGQVIPQVSPHRVGVRVRATGRSESCLPEHVEASGTGFKLPLAFSTAQDA